MILVLSQAFSSPVTYINYTGSLQTAESWCLKLTSTAQSADVTCLLTRSTENKFTTGTVPPKGASPKSNLEETQEFQTRGVLKDD